jgi:hypothetical protein
VSNKLCLGIALIEFVLGEVGEDHS